MELFRRRTVHTSVDPTRVAVQYRGDRKQAVRRDKFLEDPDPTEETPEVVKDGPSGSKEEPRDLGESPKAVKGSPEVFIDSPGSSRESPKAVNGIIGADKDQETPEIVIDIPRVFKEDQEAIGESLEDVRQEETSLPVVDIADETPKIVTDAPLVSKESREALKESSSKSFTMPRLPPGISVLPSNSVPRSLKSPLKTTPITPQKSPKESPVKSPPPLIPVTPRKTREQILRMLPKSTQIEKAVNQSINQSKPTPEVVCLDEEEEREKVPKPPPLIK